MLTELRIFVEFRTRARDGCQRVGSGGSAGVLCGHPGNRHHRRQETADEMSENGIVGSDVG